VADRAEIAVKDERLLRHIDTVTGGAFSSFVAGARRVLGPIMADAARRAPVDLDGGGTFARGFRMVEALREDSISVSVVNTAVAAPFVKFSVRLESSIKAEAARKAGERRPNSPTAADKVEAALLNPKFPRSLTWWHGRGAPEEKITGRKALVALVRTPGRRASRAFIDEQRAALARLAQGST